jgi:hypothetical protein
MKNFDSIAKEMTRPSIDSKMDIKLRQVMGMNDFAKKFRFACSEWRHVDGQTLPQKSRNALDQASLYTKPTNNGSVEPIPDDRRNCNEYFEMDIAYAEGSPAADEKAASSLTQSVVQRIDNQTRLSPYLELQTQFSAIVVDGPRA